MILSGELVNVESFASLKKGDTVVCEWRIDMYKGNKETRFAAYEVVENKPRTTEIILQVKHNVYFNYMMFLYPESHGVSNLKSIILVMKVGD